MGIVKTTPNPPKTALAELRYFAKSLRGLLALDEWLGEAASLEEASKAQREAHASKLAVLEERISAAAAELAALDAQIAERRATLERISTHIASVREKLSV